MKLVMRKKVKVSKQMKLFYSDVDDTIICNNEVTEELDNSLNLVYEKKDFFIPCSGRPSQSLIQLFKNKKVKYIIGYNGAEIIDVPKNKKLFTNSLESKEVLEVTKYLDQIKCDFLIYGSKLFASNPTNKYAKKEQKLCMMEMVKLNKQNIGSSPKILGLADPNEIEDIIKLLKKKFPKLEIETSKPYFIEITQAGISKGNAIKKLNEILGAQTENSYCFGDGKNDLSMFELEINKIAVENAEQKLKELADYVTTSCADNGVPKYIKKIYLERDE